MGTGGFAPSVALGVSPGPAGTLVYDQASKFLVVVAVETGARVVSSHALVVAWRAPVFAPVESFRPGRKGANCGRIRAMASGR